MAPFANIWGLMPNEFKSWGNSFFLSGQKVVMVEGDLDVEYFDIIRKTWPDNFCVSDEVEFSRYGGKDTLKNYNVGDIRFTQNWACIRHV